MCGLAVTFRRPLHEIALWPAAELQLLAEYLRKRPAAEDRIELALARGQALYMNRHLKEGAQPTTPASFLPYLHPWAEPDLEEAAGDGRYSALDLEIMKGLK